MQKMMISALLLTCAFSGGAMAETLAKVGSEKIEREEFEAKAAGEERNLGRKLSREERLGLLGALVNQRLLVAEARSRKLDKDPAVKQALEDQARKLLSDIVYNKEVAGPASQGQAEVEVAYKKDAKAFEVALISQVLAAAQPGREAAALARANTWKAKLSAPAKTFAALAQAESDDNVNKANGGEIGWVRRGALVPELDKAVFAAKAGSVTGPIKTQFGYHVIFVRERRQPTLAQVQQELANAQAVQLQQKLLDELKKRHKVSSLEDKL